MASKNPKNGAAKPASRVSARRAKPAAAAEAAPQHVETVIAVQTPVEAAQAVVEDLATAPEAIVTAPAFEPPAFKPIVEAVAADAASTEVKDTKVMETIETNVARAQAFFADFNDRAKGAVEKSTKLVAEANDFAKGNLEAIVESGKITAKGLEAFGQDAAEYGRKSFESATAAMKSLSTVKSPTDFFKMQSDFFRTSFDSYVAEASKNTEAFIKLAGEAAQPLSNRVALAAEKAKVAA